MKMSTYLATVTAGALTVAGIVIANDYRIPDDVAIPPTSGSSAETLLHVDQAGRTNIHSGGRANKRHGGRGHNQNHPADLWIGDGGFSVQPTSILVVPVSSVHGTDGRTKVKTSHSPRPTRPNLSGRKPLGRR